MPVEVLNAPPQSKAVPAGSARSSVPQGNQLQVGEHAKMYSNAHSIFLQPKLTVGAPDDPYEREADLVADRVMRMPGPGSIQRSEKREEEIVQPKRDISFIQRACAGCDKEKLQRQAGEEEEPVQPKFMGQSFLQRKCEDCKKEPEKPLPLPIGSFIQAKATAPTGVPDSVHESIQTSKGGGNHIESGMQSFMSGRMGADFSQVKIHSDNNSARSSKEINAKAFTVGNHIYFNEGQYQPHTDDGKRLLAHELTHVIQQGKAGPGINKLNRKEEPPATNTSICEQYSAAQDISLPVPGEVQSTPVAGEKATPPPPVAPPAAKPNAKTLKAAPGKKAEQPKDVAVVQTVPSNDAAADPAFNSLIADTGKQAKKQRTHEDAGKKTSDAVNAVDVTDADAVKSGAAVLAVEEDVNKKDQPAKEFNAAKFKEDIKLKITQQVPPDEKSAREFMKDKNKVDTMVDGTKGDIKQAEKNTVSDAQKIRDKEIASTGKQQEIAVAAGQSFTPEEAGARPAVRDAARAVPKPVEDYEVKMDEEHDADSLDKKMKENNLSDDQLAQSEEPQFIETLEEKQKSQKELCQVPAKMREAEMKQQQGNTVIAQQVIGSAMGAMHGKRDEQFGEVKKGQEHVQTEEEKKLQEYYGQLKVIYETTELNVKNTLDYLECMVGCTFQEAIDIAFETFKTNVSARLDYYYDWHIVNPDYEKEDKMTRAFVNAPIEEKIQELTSDRNKLDPADPRYQALDRDIARLKASKAKLRIEKIFEEEKALFVSSLDRAIDTIATMVEAGLNEAKRFISNGKAAVDDAYNKLDENNKAKALEATKDFQSKFKDLEDKVNDKETDLSDGLVKQYAESVAKLKSTFEDIRKEAALSWWERAWNKIKEIATIIFDIAKLLLNILVKAAGVIGDIVAHPIRFFGNLIEGVSTGFKNFIRRLPEHLENIIFKLVMGVVPPDISLPEKWDAKGIFSFILDFFGLSKKNIRDQAVLRFGASIVEKLEQGFDLFVIFKNEGFAGLWEHVKEKVGDMKNAIIEEVKTFFKESIIKAAIEFLLSALTPASGFIKVCKMIINVVMFFVKNLQNILKLLDGILDSMADIALGKIEKAALKVETALADILLIGIKFLAALVGINLDKIQSKISKIINAVRNPVNRSLAWLFEKAEAFASKTGLLKLVEKGKAKFEAGKEWAKENVEQGKEKVQQGIATVVNIFDWKKTRKGFKASDGKSHTIYVEKKAGKPSVIVESDPTLLSTLLSQLQTKYKEDDTKSATIIRARELLKLVEQYAIAITSAEAKLEKIKDPAAKKSWQTQIEGAYDKMMALETTLTTHLFDLLEKEDYAEMESIYGVEGLVGVHTAAPKRRNLFEADHQPSNKMLKEAASFGDAPPILQQIAASRSSWASTITLQKKRHAQGRTYGSKAKPIARVFVDELKEGLPKKTSQQAKANFLEILLQRQAKADAEFMLKSVYSAPIQSEFWKDINGQPRAEELRKKIVSQVEHGESLMINEKITAPLNLDL